MLTAIQRRGRSRVCQHCGIRQSESSAALLKCGRCATYYCDREHQKSDWKDGNHKTSCANSRVTSHIAFDTFTLRDMVAKGYYPHQDQGVAHGLDDLDASTSVIQAALHSPLFPVSADDRESIKLLQFRLFTTFLLVQHRDTRVMETDFKKIPVYCRNFKPYAMTTLAYAIVLNRQGLIQCKIRVYLGAKHYGPTGAANIDQPPVYIESDLSFNNLEAATQNGCLMFRGW
ncbi:hypothetical protein BJ878DRAFT_9644 [Calycina marina]|uniref:MYND-type domain-containing protein n=1 Tax=Calycina marina TaxID=1763456 RepID=A0A9P8CAG6_9HELO|nr:hypothetical protein BJ878DRAFT_9644 [Calycina marina]